MSEAAGVVTSGSYSSVRDIKQITQTFALNCGEGSKCW